MDLIDRALRVIRLREAGPYSAGAVNAAEGQRIGADMLRCMAHEADEPEQLAKMQKAYKFWMDWVDMELKETGTEGDIEVPTLYYESVEDANSNIGKIIQLQERAVRNDGTVPVKLIQPGWGSNGYYTSKVLESHGPKAFPAGTKMFWDHPTETEARERPERSLKDLAAELVSDAKFDANGADGPGLYANAKVFEAYKGPVDELAAHMGTSIRAFGAARDGEAEGRKGPIIESIIPSVMNSIDFVTLPGAGGQIVSIFEAARGLRPDAEPIKPIQEATVGDQNKETPEPTPPTPPTPPTEPTAIAEAVRVQLQPITQQLEESKRDNQRLQEAMILRDARDIVTLALAKLPNVADMTKARLVEALSANPPVKDGKIDTEAYTTKITEAVTAELNYLAGATGTGPVVVDMGGGSGTPGGNTTPLEESQKGLDTAFGRLGLNEGERKVAISGRTN